MAKDDFMEFDETKDIKLKDKPLLTVIEAAKYFGIGKNKMNDLSNKKEELVLWVGGRKLIKKDKMLEYLMKEYSI